MIGNKCDLEEEREVSKEELEEYCKEKKIEFYETSAIKNINLKEVFNRIVDLIFQDKTDEEIIKIPLNISADSISFSLNPLFPKSFLALYKCLNINSPSYILKYLGCSKASIDF